MTADEVRGAVEAILFLAGEPVSIDQLSEALGGEPKEVVAAELDRLRIRFDQSGSGIALEQAAGGYRFATRPAFDPFLRKFFSKQSEARLSMAGLETLSIIAYRQPITAPEINEVRGVNSAGVLRTLLDRRMVRIAGRKPVVGSPFLYRTTKEFLVHFGLNSIQDLPRLEEFSEMLGVNLPEEMVLPDEIQPEEADGRDSETGTIEPASDDAQAPGYEGQAAPRSDDAAALSLSETESEAWQQDAADTSDAAQVTELSERGTIHEPVNEPTVADPDRTARSPVAGEDERKPVESTTNDQD
jgi:segregation and condensation protein B